MKKVIPFTKTLTFKTMINEITDIEIKHNLKLEDNNEIKGDILVNGKYKITEASLNEEDFNFNLPFVIAIDPKYNIDDIEINIDDFNFDIINEEELKLDVEIGLYNIYEKEERKEIEELESIEIPVEQEELIENMEIKEDNNISNIFTNITSNTETFSSYHVYIIRESDTLEYIMDKYNVTKEELADYNDLNNIKTGTKLIIPCSND